MAAARYPADWVWMASSDPATSTTVTVAAMPTSTHWPRPRPGGRWRRRLALGILGTIVPTPAPDPVDARGQTVPEAPSSVPTRVATSSAAWMGRVVESTGSGAGRSRSPTPTTPIEANFRAVTRTRPSRDPTARL